MFTSRGLLCPSCQARLWGRGRRLHSPPAPGRVVVVHKTSRLEFERMKRNYLSEKELTGRLRSNGEDYYSGLLQRHTAHNRSLDEIHSFLSSHGISVRMRNRETYCRDDVEWADTIIAAGGDGNFLFTASKVFSSDKLVVGLNTDPSRSEGFLLLPSHIPHTELLTRLFRGQLRVRKRQRIRVTLGSHDQPLGSHDQPLGSCDQPLGSHDQPLGSHDQPLGSHDQPLGSRDQPLGSHELPVRALNEVFIGEKDHSHATYYELAYDDSKLGRQKSSGILIYTGTGSTSWAYNVNKFTSPEIRRLFDIAQREGMSLGLPDQMDIDTIVAKVTDVYNSSNVFDGDKQQLAFTVREPIVRGIYAACKTHGFAESISVRSWSWNTGLVIDGQFHYGIPYGGKAVCELHDCDRLKSVYIEELS